MNSEFKHFLKTLMEENPEKTKELMTDELQEYIDILMATESKPELTDNGKLILQYLQHATSKLHKAKDIADNIGISSRSVAGSLRKLVNDGFCEKVGSNPTVYTLTNKGSNYIIEQGE